jgi:uracil-DNA glycosylase family 4
VLKIDYEVLSNFPPGQAVTTAAELSNVDVDVFTHYLLHNVSSFEVQDELYTWLPGSRGCYELGPMPASVMVIGKMPSEEDVRSRRVFSCPTGHIVRTLLSRFGVGDHSVYFTNVVKFLYPGKTLPARFINECKFLLMQEIAMVQPTCIILMGSESCKLLIDRKAQVTKFRGAILGGENIAEALEMRHTPKLYITINPSNVIREPGLMPGFEADIRNFCEDILGETVTEVVNYQEIRSTDQLSKYVDYCIAQDFKLFAVDCEWAGKGPYTGRLRSIQISPREREGAAITLYDENRNEVCSPAHIVLRELRRLLLRPDVGIIGHSIRADIPWLVEFGLDGIDSKVVFDTILAAHTLDERLRYSLEECAVRDAGMSRYDYLLTQWLDQHPNKHRTGYDDIPTEILVPYSIADVDATMRLYNIYKARLEENPRQKELFENIVMPATFPILEMERNGLLADEARLEGLREDYNQLKDYLDAELKVMLDNPDFNFRSSEQCRKLLFEEKGLTPVKATAADGGRDWASAIIDNPSASPSTDAESLSILAHECEEARHIRDLRVVDQIVKTFLQSDSKGGGLFGAIDPDGRIRTHFSQLSETGRYRSSDINLQNIPKKQEGLLAEITEKVFGKEAKIPPLRTCFIANPGHKLIEADYVAAEIYTLAHLSGDQQLLQDAEGDIHSRNAIDLLGAKCEVHEVKEKYPALRVASKSLSFGIPYSRGANAVAREIKKAGVPCDKNKAQYYIDAYYAKYRNVKAFLDACKDAVLDPGYVENPFGRRRRFYAKNVRDESVIAAMKRESGNFPIQSTVADIMSRALYRLWAYKISANANYDLLLAIHDAIMIQCPEENVDSAVAILQQCMEGVVVPYHNFSLSTDITIMSRWGE